MQEYSLIKKNTYVEAVHALQSQLDAHPSAAHPKFHDGQNELYRPLTFKENIEAKLESFEPITRPDRTIVADDEHNALFASDLSSCTGIAYNVGTTRFKIKNVCLDLIAFKQSDECYVPVDYDSFDGVELDLSESIYNAPLTRKQFLNHKAYRVLFDDNSELMKAYWNITLLMSAKPLLLQFSAMTLVSRDQLLELVIDNRNNDSGASGCCDLSTPTPFVRIDPVKP